MPTDTAANNSVILAAVIAFIIGAIIFYLIGRASKKTPSENNPLQQPYDDLKKEYEQYKASVNAHFAKTADAVDNLTKSYKEVFTHLSEGAENLMDKAALQIEREKRQGKAVTLAYLTKVEEKAEKTIEKVEKKSDTPNNEKPTVTPRPAEAAKPSTTPKTEASTPEAAKPAAPKTEAPKTATTETAKSATPKTERPAEASKPATVPKTDTPQETTSTKPESTLATNSTEQAKSVATEGTEAIKRHIRENQAQPK